MSTVALVVTAGSRLRIFNASPALAPKGQTFRWWPWNGHAVPAHLTLGSWLGGARHWHFTMRWILVANGLLYLGYLGFRGEWRARAPPAGARFPAYWVSDATPAWEPPAYGAPARLHGPIRLGSENTRYLKDRRVAGGERRLLVRSRVRMVRREMSVPRRSG